MHSLVHAMTKVSTLIGTSLTQVPFNQAIPLEEKSYQIQQDASGRWSQKISVWLATEAEHHVLHCKVHGLSFYVHDEVLVVEVLNDVLAFDATACTNIITPSLMATEAAPSAPLGLVGPVSMYTAPDVVAHESMRNNTI